MNIMKYVNSWKQNLYTFKKRIFSCTFTDSAMDTYEKVYNMSYVTYVFYKHMKNDDYTFIHLTKNEFYRNFSQ